MGRCVVRIDRKRPHGRLAGLGESFLAGQKALARLVAEVASQPVPRRGVARIDRQHFAVKRVGLLERLGRELPSQLGGLEVKGVSPRVRCARLPYRADMSTNGGTAMLFSGRAVSDVVGLRETIMKAATIAPSTSSPIATAAQRTWA